MCGQLMSIMTYYMMTTVVHLGIACSLFSTSLAIGSFQCLRGKNYRDLSKLKNYKFCDQRMLPWLHNNTMLRAVFFMPVCKYDIMVMVVLKCSLFIFVGCLFCWTSCLSGSCCEANAIFYAFTKYCK